MGLVEQRLASKTGPNQKQIIIIINIRFDFTFKKSDWLRLWLCKRALYDELHLVRSAISMVRWRNFFFQYWCKVNFTPSIWIQWCKQHEIKVEVECQEINVYIEWCWKVFFKDSEKKIAEAWTRKILQCWFFSSAIQSEVYNSNKQYWWALVSSFATNRSWNECNPLSVIERKVSLLLKEIAAVGCLRISIENKLRNDYHSLIWKTFLLVIN